MNKKNKSLIPRDRGRPRFSKSPGSGVVRSKVPGLKRTSAMKNIFANLKRQRRGL